VRLKDKKRNVRALQSKVKPETPSLVLRLPKRVMKRGSNALKKGQRAEETRARFSQRSTTKKYIFCEETRGEGRKKTEDIVTSVSKNEL